MRIGKVKVVMTVGEAGSSIASIEKTSETSLIETYTITLTDGTTTTFDVEKGLGIDTIEKTATVGLVDTYTITLTDGSTSTFEVINGQSYTIPSDGVLYYEGSSAPEGYEETIPPAGQFSPVIYSNQERQIGVWTNGKPLYQRTVHINALPSTTFVEVDYPHNIANIDTICDYFGVVRWSNGGVAPIGARVYFQNLQTGDKLSADPCLQFQCTKTNITICVGQDRSSMTADINIRYTKTTDVAGSGQWGTDGAPMEHYNTTETVIGTWVDGKTLYRKCYKDINTGTAYVNKDLCNNLGIVVCTKAYCISWASNVFKNIQMGYNHVTKKISFMESSDYITTIVIEYTKN